MLSFFCLFCVSGSSLCITKKKTEPARTCFTAAKKVAKCQDKLGMKYWYPAISFETWISLVDVSYFSYLSSRIPLHFPSLFLNRFVDRKPACVVDFINWLSLLYFILLNISLFYSFVRKYIFSSESPVQKRKKEFFIIFTILFSVRHRYQIFIFPFN